MTFSKTAFGSLRALVTLWCDSCPGGATRSGEWESNLKLETAVRLFLTKIVQTRSIPFALEAGPVETISVDQETQTRMEAVAAAWSAKKQAT